MFPAGSLYSHAPVVGVSQDKVVEIPAEALNLNWISVPDPMLAAVVEAHDISTLLPERFTTSKPLLSAALRE